MCLRQRRLTVQKGLLCAQALSNHSAGAHYIRTSSCRSQRPYKQAKAAGVVMWAELGHIRPKELTSCVSLWGGGGRPTQDGISPAFRRQEACSDLMEVTSQVPPLLPYEDPGPSKWTCFSRGPPPPPPKCCFPQVQARTKALKGLLVPN